MKISRSRVGLQKTWRPARGHSYYMGYSSKFSVDADPDLFQRYEHTWFAGYNIKWTANLGTSISYRGSYYDYRNFGSRGDYNHILALNAVYEFNDWASVRGGLSYTWNLSDLDLFDYESGGIGGGVTLQIRF